MNVKNIFKAKNLKNPFCKVIESNSETDLNLKFLIQFSDWVDRWEKLDESGLGKGRLGKLSRETSFALSHTCKSIVQISNYLIDVFNFKYVMLGKFQTDPLEGRFSKYRQLSGGNYNVTVTQVLESEKKLKLLSLLSLNSKHGKFQIRDLKCGFSTHQEDQILQSNLHPYDSVIDNSFHFEINEHDSNILTFISGYVSYSVSNRLKCIMCNNRLSSDKKLLLEEDNIPIYILNLDRGGLRVPTLYCMEICSLVFRIFQCILNEFEDKFIKEKNQRNILLSICMRELDDGYIELCPQCGVSSLHVYKFCVRTMCNILLNNYSKCYNNNIKSENDRKRNLKLSTLKK